MPTVKRNASGKVVLKGGKVSCSCCDGIIIEPTCCMYPAEQLGDTYVVADLPDYVFAKWLDKVDGTMTKSTSEYSFGTVIIRRNETGTAWEFFDADDDRRSTIGNCLIRGDGGLTPEDDRVEDVFADSYVISFSAYGVMESVTVYRSGLCSWDSVVIDCDAQPAESYYWVGGLDYDDEEQQWMIFLQQYFVDLQSDFGEPVETFFNVCVPLNDLYFPAYLSKDNSNNTPVGGYGGPLDPEGPAHSFTVA
jgi:hypothetical protein